MIAYFNPVFDDGRVCSIDGIRLNLRFASSSDVESVLDGLHSFDATYYPSYRSFTYRHLFVFGGKLSSFSLGLCLNTVSADGVLNGFMDFNPNKVLGRVFYGNGFFRAIETPFLPCEDELTPVTLPMVFEQVYGLIKRFVKRIEVKRFDFAVDVQEKRSRVQLFRSDNRKYSQFWKSPENFTEYLGEGNSGGRVKVYNKSVESDLSYDLTRVELTCDSYDYDVFSKRFPEVYVRRVYDLQGNVMVRLLSQLPSSDLDFYLKQLDPRAKKKYRALLVQEPLRISKEVFDKVLENVRYFEWDYF